MLHRIDAFLITAEALRRGGVILNRKVRKGREGNLEAFSRTGFLGVLCVPGGENLLISPAPARRRR